MANEYLQRTPTSTGNRKIWTWSGWVKQSESAGYRFFFTGGAGSSDRTQIVSFGGIGGNIRINNVQTSGNWDVVDYSSTKRDYSSWYNLVVSVNTTGISSTGRVKVYINGAERAIDPTSSGYPSQNQDLAINQTVNHFIGREVHTTNPLNANVTDVFFIDGQALTPDVFGFYKTGKGYISVGSTQATDFRPGQWVPKSPRIIIADINSRGGFGVNGFYLPMNDSNNFGADFHCTPNSIIKLQENLPQPRCRIDGVGDYTGSLRADPYAANLVLALPFVSGGLQSGFGDYSAVIKGSGTPKTFTANGNVAIANTAGYYGSVAYFDGNSDYLRTSSNISDFQFGTGDFTIETWLWKSANGTNNYDGVVTLGTNGSATDGWFLEVSATRGYLWVASGNSINYNVSPNTSQWNHLAVCRKGNTTTMYLNGVAVGINTNAYTVPATATTLDIGGYAVGTGNYWFNGYLQDLRIYKGVAKYTGGFDVPKPYTPVGIATWRAVPDTTANNFCTGNPLTKIGVDTIVYTDGNNTLTDSGNGGALTYGTFSINSGKWYYECRVAGISAGSHILGWMLSPYSTDDSVWVRSNGVKYSASIGQVGSAFPTWSNGDVIMIAYDHSTGRLWAGKNGTWYSGQSSTYSIPDSTNWLVQFSPGTQSVSPRFQYDNVVGTKVFTTNFGQNPTFSGNTTAGTFTDSNGRGLFKYQPPSGFLSLCSANLPTPAISDPGKHFKTVLWTGDGNSGRSITGVGFTPDLVWIKSRTSINWHILSNSVTGPTNSLFSNSTNAESATTGDGYTNSFSSDGFSLQSGSNSINNVNGSGNTYVAWCWKAGGTAVTNTDGSMTSQVSVNQTAGFSIVSGLSGGAGDSTYDSYGHGLGKTPSFIIVKNRDLVDYFYCYHKSLSAGSYLILGNTNASAGAGSFTWGTSYGPNSSTLSVRQAGFNTAANQKLIFYCWAEIEGFSKFGSYVGNSSTDGVFVYTGFRPALVIIKRTDTTDSWAIFDSSRDSANPVERLLRAESSNAEATMTSLVSYPFGDLLSNGFKIRNTSTIDNTSGGSYIFAAFAESAFSYSNAK
mgnify:CR=1 FL=1